MIEELIKKTNSPEFYQNCDLKLESCTYQPSDNTFEILLSINQVISDTHISYEEWKLVCKSTEEYHGFFHNTLLPYVKLKVLDEHALLLKYHDNSIECKIKGKPEKVTEFTGDMSNIMEKETGNWITVNEYFWNNENHYKKYSKRAITIPKSLVPPIKEVCQRHGLNFQITNEIAGEDKGYTNKPNAKILIFGNEDVCPNDFNLRQPFIIAEEFIAQRIKYLKKQYLFGKPKT